MTGQGRALENQNDEKIFVFFRNISEKSVFFKNISEKLENSKKSAIKHPGRSPGVFIRYVYLLLRKQVIFSVCSSDAIGFGRRRHPRAFARGIHNAD